jgi:hypothetical protein
VIINETTAKRYWPGGDPIGLRITIDRLAPALSETLLALRDLLNC